MASISDSGTLIRSSQLIVILCLMFMVVFSRSLDFPDPLGPVNKVIDSEILIVVSSDYSSY